MTTVASRCLAAIIAAAAIAAPIRADEPRSGASEKEIRRLIDQLGSERFEDREQATQQLSQLSKSALPGLKEATKSSDAEVRRRAQQLVQEIQPPTARSPAPQLEPVIPPGKSYL